MSDVDLKAWVDTYDQAERQVLGGTGPESCALLLASVVPRDAEIARIDGLGQKATMQMGGPSLSVFQRRRYPNAMLIGLGDRS